MVTLHIESNSGATSTQISMSGFLPLTTYHKYEDDYHNHTAFTTDASGNYTYTQDISTAHFIFIQPRASTKFINDNATGGDCTLIGTWNSATRTCTLTMDVPETIQIDSNYVTLDGNGHTITGSNTGNGVYLSERTGVTINTLNVEHFFWGISLHSSSNNNLTGNTASNNSRGIILKESNNNNLINNNALNNGAGISLEDSSSNILLNNTAINNIGGKFIRGGIYGGIYHGYSGAGISVAYGTNNTLLGNTASNNVYGLIVHNPEGFLPYNSNLTVIGNNASNNVIGIKLDDSSNNNLTGNNASNNSYYGIWLYYSSNNNLKGNTINSNYKGIILGLDWDVEDCFPSPSIENNIVDNTISNNYAGISISHTGGNIIYNNIINNSNNIFSEIHCGYNPNSWNTTKKHGTNILGGPYLGGNFWAQPDGNGFSQKCEDSEPDGICDIPFEVEWDNLYYPWVIESDNIDYLPLTFEPKIVVDINITGVLLVGKSTKNVLAADYRNFIAGDPYNITITRISDNLEVFADSGTLIGGTKQTIPIDWTPKDTNDYLVMAKGDTIVASNKITVIDFEVVAPVPELSTIVLMSTGLLGLFGFIRLRRRN